MTTLEKANELYSKYDDLLNKDFINPIVFDNQLKQCALIAVDEILNTDIFSTTEDFYKKVKKEIENL
jgi:hypothetical protein